MNDGSMIDGEQLVGSEWEVRSLPEGFPGWEWRAPESSKRIKGIDYRDLFDGQG
jgi:endo-beta-N-acetylglucosaminidase D